jgi:hypothetical protein
VPVGIHLLAVETELAAVLEELFEEGFGLGALARLGKGLYQPEGAGEEGAFVAEEAVLAPVSVEERPACSQTVSDGLYAADDPWRISGFEPGPGEEQQGGVEVV